MRGRSGTGVTPPPPTFTLSSAITRSIYPLYWKSSFLGSCFAIGPCVFVSAGHHFNTVKDDVGDFMIWLDDENGVEVHYVAKVPRCDLLVLWVNQPTESYTSLRAFLPPVNSRVVTAWLSPQAPHELVLSPSTVITSDAVNCVAQGTVTTAGSSGAPVVDFAGDHVVGMHVASNVKRGSRVSDFIPARKMVAAFSELGVPCR